jgi:hypothetical protein
MFHPNRKCPQETALAHTLLIEAVVSDGLQRISIEFSPPQDNDNANEHQVGASPVKTALGLLLVFGLMCSATPGHSAEIHKLFHHQNDWIVSGGLQKAFAENSTYVGTSRKLNVLGLGDQKGRGLLSNSLVQSLDETKANRLMGGLGGEPLPEPRPGLNPTGNRRIDNTEPFRLRDNSQDLVVMNKGLCLCADKIEKKHTCGGISTSVEGMTKFFMEVARVLNKDNPYAIAMLQGRVANYSGNDVNYRAVEKAAKIVMAKMNVNITFGYQREDGTRTHIIIQPKVLSKHQRQAYLHRLMKYSPETLKRLDTLERKVAQLSGYDRVAGDYATPEETTRALNSIVSVLEKRPFSPAEMEFHRGKKLTVSNGTSYTAPNEHHLCTWWSENENASWNEDAAKRTAVEKFYGNAIERAVNKLRWNGNPSDPKYKKSVGFDWSDEKKTSPTKHPPRKETIRKELVKQRRRRGPGYQDLRELKKEAYAVVKAGKGCLLPKRK